MRNATITAFARSTHGTSAVEFALLSPLYFLLMAGMAAYGLYLGTSHSLQQVAADAARAAIAGLSADERHEIAVGYVAANAGTYPLIEAEHLTVGARDGEKTEVHYRWMARNRLVVCAAARDGAWMRPFFARSTVTGILRPLLRERRRRWAKAGAALLGTISGIRVAARR